MKFVASSLGYGLGGKIGWTDALTAEEGEVGGRWNQLSSARRARDGRGGTMKIPYVIDNQAHRLADIPNAPLAVHKGQSLDVASACLSKKPAA